MPDFDRRELAAIFAGGAAGALLRAGLTSGFGDAARCHYTGIKLSTDDWLDHRYLSLEHQTPGDETDIVVLSALINRMKTDLSDAEFRAMIAELAEAFAGGEFNPAAFPDRRFKTN